MIHSLDGIHNSSIILLIKGIISTSLYLYDVFVLFAQPTRAPSSFWRRISCSETQHSKFTDARVNQCEILYNMIILHIIAYVLVSYCFIDCLGALSKGFEAGGAAEGARREASSRNCEEGDTVCFEGCERWGQMIWYNLNSTYFIRHKCNHSYARLFIPYFFVYARVRMWYTHSPTNP